MSLAALSAGKHVFSEKPLATDPRLGRKIVAEAAKRKLLVGCAPDTFLGAAGRLARRMVDDGVIGKPIAGAAYIMSHGAEHWHPDPEFFYKPGGGPVLDMGPYYISALVNLLGPVEASSHSPAPASSTAPSPSEIAEEGRRIKVEVPTTALALLQFAAGAQVILRRQLGRLAPWPCADRDLRRRRAPCASPTRTSSAASSRSPTRAATGRSTTFVRPAPRPAQLARVQPAPRQLSGARRRRACRCDAPQDKQRASGGLALHVLEVMEAILKAGETGRTVQIREKVARPPVLTDTDAAGFLA